VQTFEQQKKQFSSSIQVYYHYQSSHEHFTSANINLLYLMAQASIDMQLRRLVYPIKVRTLKTLVELRLAKRPYPTI